MQAVTANLSASYVLDGDIDASDTEEWNDGAGFEPIGDETSTFSGSFDGNGFTISELVIDRQNSNSVGMFGSISDIGSVSDLVLTEIEVTGGDNIGGLVGNSSGTIEQVEIDGTVIGYSNVGGFAGISTGEISDSSAQVSVTGEFIDTDDSTSISIGGFIGNNSGTVSGVSATGDVSGLYNVGGLIGHSPDGEITASNSEVDVTSSLDGVEGRASGPTGSIGGLIGNSGALISSSTVNGNITVESVNEVGGLAGSAVAGSITNTSVTVDIVINIRFDTPSFIGGLVGSSSVSISDSTASGTITAENGEFIGGLVGSSSGTDGVEDISASHSNITITATNSMNVGGLAGELGGDTDVINSSARGDVTGVEDVGGFVGVARGNIVRSFATGDVEAEFSVGGFLGRTQAGTIENSTSSGNVTGDESVGGFVGDMGGSISTSYSIGFVTINSGGDPGGFVGSGQGDITDSYWDTESSGTDSSGTQEVDGITGLTTDEFQGSSVYDTTELAFNPVWIATDDYPLLVWQVDDYTLSLSETDLDEDDTADSTVTLSLTDGTTQTATEPANYSTGSPSVATVADGGEVTGTGSGTTALTAEASGFEDSVSLSVTAATTGGSSSSSSDDDDEPVEEEPPEEEPADDDSDGTTGSSGDDEEPEETDIEPDSEDEEATLSPARIIVGSGAGAAGVYVAVVLLSRTELFAAAAPASVAQAVASVPGAASYILAEPEQAAFVVAAVTLATDREEDDETDVDPGETLEVEVTIENKGDIPGAREVTLTLDESEDSATLDIDAHTAKMAVLEYQTTAADAGKTLGFTIDCETDSTDIDVIVSEPTGDNDEKPMSDTKPADTDAPDDEGTDVADDDIPEEEETAEAEADEEDLDAGTRTGMFDRIWMEKGKILSYTAGVIIIYIGLQNIGDNVFAGGLGLFLGVMALPIVRAQLPTSTRVLISRYGKALVVIFAALFSGVLVDPAVVYEAIGNLLP